MKVEFLQPVFSILKAGDVFLLPEAPNEAFIKIDAVPVCTPMVPLSVNSMNLATGKCFFLKNDDRVILVEGKFVICS